MDDERIELWPPLGLEYRCDRFAIARVGAEPVNRLGREGDKPAVTQEGASAGKTSLVAAQFYRGFRIHSGHNRRHHSQRGHHSQKAGVGLKGLGPHSRDSYTGARGIRPFICQKDYKP